MTDAMLRDDCPAESALHDLADGVLEVEEANGVRAHLAHCARCDAMLARLLALRARVKALPRELPPPAALWDDVRARLAGNAVSTSAPHPRWWRRPSRLAAAALLLMALSSSVTVTVMRARGAARIATRFSSPVIPVLDPGETGNLAAIESLSHELDRRRGELSPETIAAVERSLDIVDQALAEAREALARDPRNPTLSELVATAYRHKLTVLRRATELAPRS